MTHLENDYATWIESVTYLNDCEYAIPNIVDIIEFWHILAVVWTILYDKPQPL